MTTFKHLKQTKSNNCGQTCVAMLTGKTIAEVEKVFGHAHGSFSFEQIKALNTLGCVAGPSMTPKDIGFKIPQIGLLSVSRLKRSGGHYSTTGKTIRVGHLVVIVNGMIYDPSGASYPVTAIPGNKIVRSAIEVLVP